MTSMEGEIAISNQIDQGIENIQQSNRDESINGIGLKEDYEILKSQGYEEINEKIKKSQIYDQLCLEQSDVELQSSYQQNMMDQTNRLISSCQEQNHLENKTNNISELLSSEQTMNMKLQDQDLQHINENIQEEVKQEKLKENSSQEVKSYLLSNFPPEHQMDIEEQEDQKINHEQQIHFMDNPSGIMQQQKNKDVFIEQNNNQILLASNQITILSNQIIKPSTSSFSDSNRIDSDTIPGKISEEITAEKGSQNDQKHDNNHESSISNDDSKKNSNNLENDKLDIEEPQCEKLVIKDYGMENILKHVYNPLALEALQGDIFIDLNYDYANSQLFGQPSLMNQYKHLTSVENFEERGLVELNLQSHYTPVYDFTHLTEALCDHQEPSLRELGQKLQKYQKVAHKMQEKGKQFRQQQEEELERNANTKDNNGQQNSNANNKNPSQTAHQDLGAAMVESYKKFEKEARKFLSELKKRSKIFFYTLRQLSLTSFSYELKKYGYSAEFLQLLGYNVQQFKNLTVRKGMIELQNFTGRIALNKMSLDLLIGEIKDCVRIKTSYITSDNLELQVDGIVKQIFNTAHSSEIFPYFQFLSIIVLDVQTNTMKEIYSIRYTNKQIQHQYNQMYKNQENANKQNKQQQLGNSQSHSDSEENNNNKLKKSPKNKKSKGKKVLPPAQDNICSPSQQPFHNNGDRDILDIIGQPRQSEDEEKQMNANDGNSSGNQLNNSKKNEEIQDNNLSNMAQKQIVQEEYIQENNKNSPSPKKEKQNNGQFASPMKYSGDNQLNSSSSGNKTQNNEGILSNNQKQFPQPSETKQLPEKNLHESQSVAFEGLSQSGVYQQSSGSVFGGPALPSILPNSEEIDVDEYYSMETQILLDKFYENSSSARRKVKRIKKNTVQADRNQVKTMLSTHEHLLSGKTCGFRFLKPISKKSSFCNNTSKQK